MKCCRFLLNVRDKYSVSGRLVAALNDHDAQPGAALVDPDLSPRGELGELIALKNLKNGKHIYHSLFTENILINRHRWKSTVNQILSFHGSL